MDKNCGELETAALKWNQRKHMFGIIVLQAV